MEPKVTHIGGQAVIEGVMMRGKNTYTLAVRTPDEEIYTEDVEIVSILNKYKFLKWPIIRGIVSFVESLFVGTKIITKSAEIAGLNGDEIETSSKFEKWLEKKFGDNLSNVIIIFSVILSIVLSVLLFMLLPVFLSGLIKKIIPFESSFLLSFIEGVIKMIIFLIYIVVISKMEDIQRVFMYHGSEHKTINCFEQGEELTVENVRKYTRLHKRCGTSFLLIVMVVSIITFMLVGATSIWGRVFSRILLVPFVAGFSYEIIRWAGKNDSKLVQLVSKPGMMLQLLTTKEPTDDQIEVAIAAMKGVLACEAQGV